DEQANIAWAQALEQVGVHVVYGVVGLKTHAKVALVVRREGEEIQRYVHVGTGNYNPKTAQIYEDVGLLSADPELGSDVSELFNFLTGYSRQRRFGRLLVAPVGLRSNIIRLIRREAARPVGGRIVLKVNSLVDPEIVEALYAASQSGTEIDLIVRGLCSPRGLDQRLRDGCLSARSSSPPRRRFRSRTSRTSPPPSKPVPSMSGALKRCTTTPPTFAWPVGARIFGSGRAKVGR